MAGIPASTTRLVLDTNVWLDLLLFEDPRCARLRAALDGGSAVALSDRACREEWLRVLHYPALRLTAAHTDRLRARYDAMVAAADASLRPRPFPTLPRCRDPDDQKFLELACAGRAAALVSRDDALLALAARFRRAELFLICRPDQWPP